MEQRIKNAAIARKAAIVLLAVGLQKPSQKSKTKDHQECLAKRLVLWKEGETDKLLSCLEVTTSWQLREKHPSPKEARLESLPLGHLKMSQTQFTNR